MDEEIAPDVVFEEEGIRVGLRVVGGCVEERIDGPEGVVSFEFDVHFDEDLVATAEELVRVGGAELVVVSVIEGEDEAADFVVLVIEARERAVLLVMTLVLGVTMFEVRAELGDDDALLVGDRTVDLMIEVILVDWVSVDTDDGAEENDDHDCEEAV